MGTIREGRWKCSHCGEESLGRHKECQSCGADRPVNVKFYLPGDAPPVTDPGLLALARKGPDWTCEFCATDNAADRTHCEDCGAERGTSPSRPVRDYSLDEVPRTADDAEELRWGASRQSQVRPMTGVAPAPKWKTALPSFGTSGFGLNIRTMVIAAVIILAIAGLTFFLFRTHEEVLTVTGYHWERSIKVECYKTLTQEGWEGELPGDARIVSSRTAVHHYNQVACGSHTEYYQDCDQKVVGYESYVCGHRDLGNGFFEDVECERAVHETVCEQKSRNVTDYCDEPVYRTKHTYQVDRWTYDRTEQSSSDNHNPYWPNISFGGNEREIQNGRGENYVVYLTNDNGKTYNYGCGYDDWRSFDLGSKYHAKVNRLGMITNLE